MQAKERERLKRLIARRQADSSEEIWRPVLGATHKSIEALVMGQPGIKAAKRDFQTRAGQALTKADSMATRQRKAATAASRKRGPLRKSMARERIGSFRKLTGLNSLTSPTPRFLLQTPFEVSLTGATLTEHGVTSGSSFVRFAKSVGSGRSGAVRANFSYLWQNPTDKYAVINAHGYLILDGYLQLGVGSGFLPGDRRASIRAEAFMEVHDWGPEPALASAVTFTRIAADLSESDDGFGAVGALAAQDVFRGFDLDNSMYIVRPGATVGLVVAGRIVYSTGDDSSSVAADFESGGHRIISPGVLIQIVS